MMKREQDAANADRLTRWRVKKMLRGEGTLLYRHVLQKQVGIDWGRRLGSRAIALDDKGMLPLSRGFRWNSLS